MARKIYRFEWWMRPDRDEAWFEHEKTRLLPDAFAREILISFDFSASGVVFSGFSNDHIKEGDFQFSPDLPLYRAVDFGRTCAALFAQKDSFGRFIFFKEIILEPSSTKALAMAVENETAQYLSYVTKPFDTCDPAGNTVSFTANSTDIQILNEHNIFPQFDKIQRSKNRLMEGVQLIKARLAQRDDHNIPTIFVNRKGCPKLIEAFQSGYRYKVNRSTQEILDVIEEKHPYEDVVDCLRYTLLQFGSTETKKKDYNFGVTTFAPTKNQPYRPNHRFNR